jgi:hypothetical protein
MNKGYVILNTPGQAECLHCSQQAASRGRWVRQGNEIVVLPGDERATVNANVTARGLYDRIGLEGESPDGKASMPTTTPRPDHYYQIQQGSRSLLTTAGRAYGLAAGAERLRRAKEINAHARNRRFWRAPQNDFERANFPEGIISFTRVFTCEPEQRRAKTGETRCFARIWIPSEQPTVPFKPAFKPRKPGVDTPKVPSRRIGCCQDTDALLAKAKSFHGEQLPLRDKLPKKMLIGVRPPTLVRPLDAGEVKMANDVFRNSLDYGHIFVTDGKGRMGRPWTIALQLSRCWCVLMNVGEWANESLSIGNPRLLIHELVHAWQSQHAKDPRAFMWNSALSQAAAFVRPFEEASAYAYVPGDPFEKYAAEQIAVQVEDRVPEILRVIQAYAPHEQSPENERSLSLKNIRYALKSEPGVRWRG